MCEWYHVCTGRQAGNGTRVCWSVAVARHLHSTCRHGPRERSAHCFAVCLRTRDQQTTAVAARASKLVRVESADCTFFPPGALLSASRTFLSCLWPCVYSYVAGGGRGPGLSRAKTGRTRWWMCTAMRKAPAWDIETKREKGLDSFADR